MVHSRSPQHTLIDLVAALGQCPQHALDFSRYCLSCKACLCEVCVEKGALDHLLHRQMELSSASELKKKRLQQVLMTLVTKMQKIPDQIKQLESAKGGLIQKICDVTCLVNEEDPLAVLQERESERSDFCDLQGVDSERRIRKLLEELDAVTKYIMVVIVVACLLFVMVCFLVLQLL